LSTKVYTKLLQVPKGKVTTYGDLAKSVGLKNGQRIIGMIMKNNPFPVIIPCHRVVRSDGKIGGYTYGEMVKFKMLTKEGIKIKDGKIIDFDKEKFYFLPFCFDVISSINVLRCAIFLTVFPPIFL